MIHYTEQLDILRLLKDSKYTQKQLAKKMHISEQWLSTLINKDVNDLPLSRIEQICSALGYTLNISVISS